MNKLKTVMQKKSESLHKLTNLQNVKEKLQNCKHQSGFFNPMAAFDILNDINRKQNPKAYENELE